MGIFDLHIHTNASDDADFPPEAVLKKCAESDVDHIAVTDHNSIESVDRAMELGPGLGIRVISGVELDAIHRGVNFHIAGYCFNHHDPRYREIEEDIRQQEMTASDKRLELFYAATGLRVTREETKAMSGVDTVAGEMVAEVLMARDDARDSELLAPYRPGGDRGDNPYVNFYWDYFSQGKAAYVPMEFMSVLQAVDLIHDTGGKAILAHPGQNLGRDEDMLASIIATGVDGIEAYSSYHSKEDAEFFAERAGDLLVTCGSDFHGRNKPAIKLGGHGAPAWVFGKLAALFDSQL